MNNSDKLPIGDNVEYIDPQCIDLKDKNWDKIADSSKTYIWGINCPIVLPLRFSEKQRFGYNILGFDVLVYILEHAWKALKDEGYLIFNLPTSEETQKEDDYIIKLSNFINTTPEFTHKWNVSIIIPNDFIFYLVSSSYRSVKLLIFTKKHTM
jgi:hypothetical protein